MYPYRMTLFFETCEDKFKIKCAKMTPEYQFVSSPVLPEYLSDCIILSKKIFWKVVEVAAVGWRGSLFLEGPIYYLCIIGSDKRPSWNKQMVY